MNRLYFSGERKATTCEVCGKTFSTKGNLKTHMKLHFGVKEYQCDVCHKEFTQKFTLKCHMLTHM